jgi:hypothetical protein
LTSDVAFEQGDIEVVLAGRHAEAALHRGQLATGRARLDAVRRFVGVSLRGASLREAAQHDRGVACRWRAGALPALGAVHRHLPGRDAERVVHAFRLAARAPEVSTRRHAHVHRRCAERAGRFLDLQRERNVGLAIRPAQKVRQPREPRVALGVLSFGGVVDDLGEGCLLVEADSPRLPSPLRVNRERGGQHQRRNDDPAAGHGSSPEDEARALRRKFT